MKIVIFSHDFSFGGTEVVAVNLANAYLELGYEVSLVVLTDHGDLKQRVNRQVDIINLNCRLRSSFKKIASYLKSIDKDEVIILSTIRNLNLVLAAINRYLMGSSFVQIGHEANTYRQMLKAGFLQKFTYHLYRLLVRLMYSRIDLIVANSEDVKMDLLSMMARPSTARIKVIGNPIATPVKPPQVKNKNRTPKAPVIVSVGRLTEQKDYELAFDSLNIASKKFPDLVYTVYGKGELQGDVERFVKGAAFDAKLLPPNESLVSIFQRADVFLLTSKWEGFGNVVVEAMSFGVTPVVVDCPGGPKDIVGKKFGYVCARVADDIAAAVNEAIQRPIAPDRLISRSMEYNALHIAERYLSALR